jgi:hypothetical protein
LKKEGREGWQEEEGMMVGKGSVSPGKEKMALPSSPSHKIIVQNIQSYQKLQKPVMRSSWEV